METYIVAPDLHYPQVNKPAWKALTNFLEHNHVDGFIFLGDQFDNAEISHHNRKKIIFRERAAYAKHTLGFEKSILTPLEERLDSDTEKVWVIGNHDGWEQELIEENPELEGTIERPMLLDLERRGWQVVEEGKSFKKGKVTFIHGETLTGIGNQVSGSHAKKAVEVFCSNVVYGHLHSPQSFTKILPHDETNKWMSYCMPILGDVNPVYLRNRPTAWLNGFGIVEFHSSGNFNVYTVIVSEGKFAYGGKVYPIK